MSEPAKRLRLKMSVSKWLGYLYVTFTADGYSLDDKRTTIGANEIPDALTKWPTPEEGLNSYRVPIEKIQENDWSLAAGRYKPVTAEPVHHDNPQCIVAEVLAIEARITEKLTRLQGMVKWEGQ